MDENGNEMAGTDLQAGLESLPEHQAVRKEMQTAVRNAVDRLPDKMKVTVLLYYHGRKKRGTDCGYTAYSLWNSKEQAASGQKDFGKRIGVCVK